MIESSLVGLVIGRQGENLRRVEQDSGTRIQFITGPNQAGPQRQCRITGNPRARADAKREIYHIIEENGGTVPRDTPGRDMPRNGSNDRFQPQQYQQYQPQQPPKTNNQPIPQEGENAIQIMVPDRTVGLIIGRGGETIRDLQERSGCHINIVGANKSINGLRPVNLIGSPDAASRAKDLIMEIVESDTRSAGQQASNNQAQQSVQSQPQDTQSQPNKITETIMVPSEAVGMIIGKGGEAIKEMQNVTSCKINVSQASGSDVEREIGLVGTYQAIEAAKAAIAEKVEAAREKHSGGGYSNRGSGRRDNAGDRYSQPQYGGQQQQQQNQQQPYAQPQQPGSAVAPPAGAGDTNAADPYAAWGGYQNYMALWYAAYAQQQQQGGQPAAGQSGQAGPPGA